MEGATYKAHIKNNKVWYLSGSFIDIFEDLNTSPSISSAAAFTLAKNHVGASRYIWDEGEPQPSAKLVIVGDPNGKTAPHLAYKLDIYATAPLYRAYVYVDAHSGQVVKENLRIHHTDQPITGVSTSAE